MANLKRALRAPLLAVDGRPLQRSVSSYQQRKYLGNDRYSSVWTEQSIVEENLCRSLVRYIFVNHSKISLLDSPIFMAAGIHICKHEYIHTCIRACVIQPYIMVH